MSSDLANPECTICKGAGFLFPESLFTRPGEQGGRFCECALDALRLQNMERIWKSLSSAKDLGNLREKPPLKEFTQRDMWITADDRSFRGHLKAAAFKMSSMWDCRVFSDKDLVAAWLATARAQGHRIYDTEIEDVRISAMDIDELVEPPTLVVLLLGAKHAKNQEAPNVLLEAISSRKHLGKPTWLVDQPDHRIDDPYHRCYSEQLEGWLEEWPHVTLEGRSIKKAQQRAHHAVSADMAAVAEVSFFSENEISAGSSAPETATTEEVEEPVARSRPGGTRDLLDITPRGDDVPSKKKMARKNWRKGEDS